MRRPRFWPAHSWLLHSRCDDENPKGNANSVVTSKAKPGWLTPHGTPSRGSCSARVRSHLPRPAGCLGGAVADGPNAAGGLFAVGVVSGVDDSWLTAVVGA